MTSEAITVDLFGLAWRKSSRSAQGNDGNCVEVAFAGRVVAVRDSKNPAAEGIAFSAKAWAAFLLHRH